MEVNNLQAFRIGAQIANLNGRTADYQLLYVIAGKLNILLDEQSYNAVPGQVVITTLTNRDLTFHPSDDFEGYLLQIDDPIVAGLIQQYLLYMKLADSLVIVLTAGRQDQSIRSLFENIMEELQADADSAATIIELRLQELLIRLYRTSPKISSGTYSSREEIVSSIQELLKKKYYTALSLESIAAEYNISVSYLAHIFKDITGMSVMRCLLLIRVREAQRYLVQTSMQINEIAEKCGFKDVSNFGRTFRKETGCAPRQYRQAHTLSDKKEKTK